MLQLAEQRQAHLLATNAPLSQPHAHLHATHPWSQPRTHLLAVHAKVLNLVQRDGLVLARALLGWLVALQR